MNTPQVKALIRATAEQTTHSRADVSLRTHTLSIDEPEERGGTDVGPSPTETLMGALVGCTNVIGHKCAKKLGVDIGELDIKLRCEFDRRGVLLQEEVDLPFTKINLDVSCHGSADQSQIDAVAAEVAKFCPLAKLFREAGTVIDENWHPAG